MPKDKMSSIVCAHLLKDVTVSADLVEKLFDTEKKELKSDSYANAIDEVLRHNYGCSYNIRHKNCSKNTITVYAYCIVNEKKIYSIKCYCVDIVKGQPVTLQIRTNINENCTHQQQDIRNLSKDKRKTIQEDLKNATTTKVYRNQLPAKGPIHSRSVIQKARSLVLSQNDLDKDVLIDLKLKANVERKENDSFIQKIEILPLSVYLFSPKIFRVLNDELRKGYVRLNLDATGGIITSFDNFPVLNHILLLTIKSHEKNKSAILFNLAELITNDQSGFNIGNFLRHFKVTFMDSFPSQKKIANSIVTDKSYANINAILDSQNGLSLRKYLHLMFDLFNKKIEIDALVEIVFVFLCANHQTKTWKDDIFKHFTNKMLTKDDKLFICALMGTLMNIETKEEFDTYITSLFIIFCSKSKDAAYMNAFAVIKTIAKNIDTLKEKYTTEDEQHDEIEETDTNVIYKSSKFYIAYEEILKNIQKKIDKNAKVENRFFNPDYAFNFLKKNLSLLPLWSRIFTSIGMETYKRPSNAPIEGYNKIIKSTLQKDHAMNLGKIQINRYVPILKEKLEQDLSLIEHKVLDHHVTRKTKSKKKEETHSSLPSQLESWGGEGRVESTVFFNTTKVSEKAAKEISSSGAIPKQRSQKRK